MSTCRYEYEKTIAGLKESIAALEFSPDGKTLASGCEDGSVTIFSTFDWKPLQRFIGVSPSTSLTWHPQAEGPLFCGFKNGDIHTLQTVRPQVRSQESQLRIKFDSETLLQANVRIRTDASNGPIHCISHGTALNTLAVGSGNQVILADYSIQSERTASWHNTRRLPAPPGFPQLRAAKLPEPTAQSIHFLQEKDSLIVSYLHHGIVLVSSYISCGG